jgi:hypothetical protein
MIDESIEEDQTSEKKIYLRNIYNLLLQPVVYDRIKSTKKALLIKDSKA